MKKLSIIALAIMTFGMISCDMDLMPYDSIPTEEVLTTVVGFEEARAGIYAAYTGLTGGSYVLAPEIQADAFNAVADFSNKYGDIYRWMFESTHSTIESIWANCYSTVGRANFFIDGVQKIEENPEIELTDIQKKQINVYEGEAYFTRAYCYFYLATLFCRDYDPITAASIPGLPIQTKYEPKITASQYPGRSSLKDTYQQILDDLEEVEIRIETAISGIIDYDRYINGAYVTVNTAPKNCGNYITVDVVKALKARVALQMDDYEKAVEYADDLINSKKYPLMDTVEGFKEVWKNDGGTETIWQIAMTNANDAGVPLGTIFIGYPATKKDYIPTQTLVDLYATEDIRLATYFGKYHLTVSSGNAADIYFFNKYPGNDYYNALGNETRYLNQPKPFRIAEMYLIAAEANARIGTSISVEKGKEAINNLKKARILGFMEGTYDKESLLNEVMNERERELVGEGYRLMDLKRWERGVTRGKAQSAGLILFPGQTTTDGLDRPADDQRMVWPIPKSEMDANPQLTGQQNPGY